MFNLSQVPIDWHEVDVTPVIINGASSIPEEAIVSIKKNTVALKGPLATPSQSQLVSSLARVSFTKRPSPVYKLQSAKVTSLSILLSVVLSPSSPTFVPVGQLSDLKLLTTM